MKLKVLSFLSLFCLLFYACMHEDTSSIPVPQTKNGQSFLERIQVNENWDSDWKVMKQIGRLDLDEVACFFTLTGKLYAVFPIVSEENIEAVVFYTFDVDSISVKIQNRPEIMRKSEISESFWALKLCESVVGKQWEMKGYRLPINLELVLPESVETKVSTYNSFEFRITYRITYYSDEELRNVARHINQTFYYCQFQDPKIIGMLNGGEIHYSEVRGISTLTFCGIEDRTLMEQIAGVFIRELTMRLGRHFNVSDVQAELLWFPVPVTILRCGHIKCNQCNRCLGQGIGCKSCDCHVLVCMHKKCPYKKCGKCLRSAIEGACNYCSDPEGHWVGYYIETKCPHSSAIFNDFALSVRDTIQWRNVEVANGIIKTILMGANIIEKMSKKINLYSMTGAIGGSCSSTGIGINSSILTTGGPRLVSVLVHEYFHNCQGFFVPSANIEVEAKMAQAVFGIKSGFGGSVSYGSENYEFMKKCESFYRTSYSLYLQGDKSAIKKYDELLEIINGSDSRYVINSRTPSQNFATLIAVE